METMHPFWAVRRMTQKQLVREGLDDKSLKIKPRFNCSMVTQTMSNVTVGVVKGMSVNVPKCCEVQFLTNSVDLLEGEELILEVPEKKPKQATPKRTSNCGSIFLPQPPQASHLTGSYSKSPPSNHCPMHRHGGWAAGPRQQTSHGGYEFTEEEQRAFTMN